MSSPLGAPFPGCNCPVCVQARQSPGVWMHSQCALLQEHLQPQPPMFPKEIVAAPVEGWRIWKAYPPMWLGPVGAVAPPWDPVTRARCHNLNPIAIPPHSAPFAGCGCGLWAFKDDRCLTDTLRRYAAPATVYGYGRVQLWGKIIEHEHGWRGEYARPVAVTLLGADDKTAAAIREFYGCEVTVEAELDGLRAEQAKYWQPHRAYTQPVGPPVVSPTPSQRRSLPNPVALMCLALAIVNTVFACLGAFDWHNGASRWVMNAIVAFFGFIVAYLCWDTP